MQRLTSSGPFGRSSIAYCTQPRNTASGLRCSQKPIQPERARCVANERIPIATATCSGVRAATKHARSVCVSNIPRTADLRTRRRVDGSAVCASMGRPQLVRDTTLSREGKSQRGAHKPEYRQRGESCLRGYGIANIPPEESSRFSAGRTSNIVRSGLHRGVVFTWPVRYARMAACATPLGRVLTCRDESSR